MSSPRGGAGTVPALHRARVPGDPPVSPTVPRVSRASLATAIQAVADADPVVARLVEAVGPMYLMFALRRLDVWPVDDLGVRQGYGLAWALDPPPTPRQLQPLGDRFRPYRSVVARYCWEAVALARRGSDPALR
jgi:hypothetical protein